MPVRPGFNRRFWNSVGNLVMVFSKLFLILGFVVGFASGFILAIILVSFRSWKRNRALVRLKVRNSVFGVFHDGKN